jgi:hypothetical protein
MERNTSFYEREISLRPWPDGKVEKKMTEPRRIEDIAAARAHAT